jgi:NAD(P)-dependent dehydrogenase (short-subunit alcohol dehydrogenase family)
MPDALRVMVTGAAAGIGAAIAAGFADDGARVSIADVDPGLLDAAVVADPRLSGVAIDIADESAVDAWFDDVLEEWGGLDVLVNNAGIAGPTAYVEDVSLTDWRRCLAVGLDSHFLTARRAAAVMKAQSAGSIINISSTAGQYGYGLRTPYASAKWAVIGLTKSLAVELGPHGVRVNAICPGSVDGPRMQGVIEREATRRGLDASSVAAEYTQGQSIHRFVQPTEIADLCRFLASPAASMISGQAIAVDGHTETFHL